jgi:DNA-binding MarR family transcriptional regulator
MDAPKPLGYWLQHLHNLLEEHFALVLSDLATSRREWQMLNTLVRGVTDVKAALAPFWTGEPALSEVIASLAARGWITFGDEAVALTPAGVAAHAEIRLRVEESRTVVAAGLTPDQYQETVRLLSVMAANVEAAIASRPGAVSAVPGP